MTGAFVWKGLLSLVFAASAFPASAVGNQDRVQASEGQRTIWMSDLHDPVNDPDDHYDLAIGFGSGLLDDGLIVVDEAAGRRPARASVAELAKISGRKAPPVAREVAIARQIRFLRRSPKRSVTVVTLGSLAGLAALLKRKRSLLVSRVREVWVFAGDAAVDSEREYNVTLDPRSFRRVMASALPIRWVPCFDGGLWQTGTSSFVATYDSYLMALARPAIRSWFQRHVGDKWGIRNLWAAGNLSGFRPKGVRWQSATFRFSNEGVLQGVSEGRSNVKRFVVFDRERYERWLLRVTRRVLGGL